MGEATYEIILDELLRRLSLKYSFLGRGDLEVRTSWEEEA